MKPAIDTDKRAHNLRSSSSQPSSADHHLGRLHKELKRERKRERENVRFVDVWEQYKTLWDGIEFKRQLINMGDKKVRFALAIMAALNAGMLVVLTRGPIAQIAANGLGSWLGIPLERRMWSNARLSDITGELILFNRSSSFVLKRQMEEIRRVYQRLKVLVILATVVLTLVVGSGVVRSGTGTFNALISLR